MSSLKSNKLELVHTDIWGPSAVASLCASKYYATFIDDSSRKDGSIFLNICLKLFCFQDLEGMVENETSLKIKILRSDNSREYTDKEFKQYYANNSIVLVQAFLGKQ